jgi:hypothetical protein
VKVSSKKASSLYILTPQPFDFEYTAHSHGWSVLPPNQWATGILKRVERLSSGAVVALAISSSPKSSRIRIQVNHSPMGTGYQGIREVIAVSQRI